MIVLLLIISCKWLTFSLLTLLKKDVFSAVASRYGAVLIPSAPGALYDLAQDNELAKLLNTFVQEKSECMQLLVYFSQHAWRNPRQSWILDSRFQALNSRFLVSGTWIPDISSHWWDSVHIPWAVMWIVCCLLQCFFLLLFRTHLCCWTWCCRALFSKKRRQKILEFQEL